MRNAIAARGAGLVQRARGSLVLFAVPVLLVGGCTRNPTIVENVAELALVLPAAAPYITGVIGSVDSTSARMLVERSPGVQARSAFVAVHSAPPIFWRDGRRGSRRDLEVGRVVTVWVSGPELRSLPPQVSADVIVVER